MKAAIITNDIKQAKRVYDEHMIQVLQSRYDLCKDVLNKKNLPLHISFSKEVEYLFSTWGMEHFSVDEIRRFFPNLKCIFYAAGSVQHFAKEFLECGVKVFSAWKANAVPVAEYTYAQIILAAKGFYRAERKSRLHFYAAAKYSDKCGGNYRTKIGIIGVGSIGTLVAQKLMQNDVDVLYYDPFLSTQKAEKLNICAASLERIFSECDIITNHLADKTELNGILSGDLFNKMKPYATFINTGRGKQVDEKGLVKAMKKVKTRTALLDVTQKEPLPFFSGIARCRNIIVTPHIAGSNGKEVVRMAEYMIEEAMRIDKNEQTLYQIDIKMLETMA